MAKKKTKTYWTVVARVKGSAWEWGATHHCLYKSRKDAEYKCRGCECGSGGESYDYRVAKVEVEE